MKSMTGFGRSSTQSSKNNSTNNLTKSSAKTRLKTEAKSKGKSKTIGGVPGQPSVQLDVSIKTVNGRYLEVRLHMPREYSAIESDIKSILGKYFSRGTVDLYINRARGSSVPDVSVNTELAKKWVDAYRSLGQSLKIKAAPTLDLITRVPEVFKVEDALELSEKEKNLVKTLVEEAAQACDQERRREGLSQSQELGGLCDRLEGLSDEMEKLKGEANQELQRRFRDRLEKLGLEGKFDEQRIAQEIVIQLDRSDVSEELTRLREHLKAYRQLLKSEEPQGKKLDFYAQELLREVNTIGSKSHIARLTSLVVDAKTLVEKIREQVQNVE